MTGSRLRALTDSSGVRCLATRNANSTQILIWHEGADKTESFTDLRLLALPFEAKRGLRLLRSTVADTKPVVLTDVPGSAGANLELPLVLRAGEIVLITAAPRRAPSPLQVTLAMPRFVWYGGENPEMTVTIRNVSATPQPTQLELTGSVAGLIPAAMRRTPSVLLPPGRTRLLRFRLAAPPTLEEKEALISAKVGTDSETSLLMRLATSFAAQLETPRLDLETSGDTVKARVKLTNRSKLPQMVTLRAESGANAKTLIPGDKTQTLEVSLEAPSREPGVYAVPLILESDSQTLANLTVLVGVPTICRYAKVKPEIDADLREWSDAVPLGMGRAEQVHLKTWGGLNDLSAIAHVAWNEQYLYVACAVADDTPGNAYPTTELWRGDSLQIAISAQRRSVGEAGGYGAGDHEFGFALIEDKPVAVRFYGDGTKGVLRDALVAVRRIGGRTFYESAIPWKEIAPLKPEAGTLLGFSLLVNDDDGRGRGYIEWGGGMGDTKRPEWFPPLRLVK